MCKKQVFISESAPFLFCRNIFEAGINYVAYDFNFMYRYLVKKDLISKNFFVSFNLSLKTHFVDLGGQIQGRRQADALDASASTGKKGK